MSRSASILLILTVIQGLYTVAVALGYSGKYTLSYEHEDLIFILHLMTLFIVLSIEKSNRRTL